MKNRTSQALGLFFLSGDIKNPHPSRGAKDGAPGVCTVHAKADNFPERQRKSPVVKMARAIQAN